MDTNEILREAIKALDSKKAVDMKVIKVADVTTLADYFIIATGSSTTQVKALAEEVDYKLGLLGQEPGHIEGRSSGWILLDYGSVVVHVFYKNDREFFSLERLWQDGEEIDYNEFLN